MSDFVHPAPSGLVARLIDLAAQRRDVLRNYLSAISGSAGRLVFSLVYFIALANALSISDFGLFATASAAGVMLSRILAFGFMSPLYRSASVKPHLIGTFTAGFLMMAVLSLPILALATAATHWLFFGGQLAWTVFALVVASEALLWRPFEAVVIVNNGLGQFGRGALLVIGGTAIRAFAAAGFAFWPDKSIDQWAIAYLAANATILAIGVAFFYPRQRLRFRPALYWRRLPDSISVSLSEVLFYLQSEFDKLIVLALGGSALAGLYAIVMRLVDLTAIPIRVFSMMLVQKMMRAPEMLRSARTRASIEAGIFLVSTCGIAAMAVVLHFFPAALGKNVAQAAPLVALALFIPGLRNLIEYQGELLYARGQTVLRTISLAMLAGLKGLMLVLVIGAATGAADIIWWINPGFVVLYIASAIFTYGVLRLPAKTF